MSDRTFFVGGNWKLNGSRASIKTLLGALNNVALPQNTEVVIAPPALYLQFVSEFAAGHLQVAAQNCWKGASGAFTGENSAEMIADLGVPWVVLGHSERRHVFGEANDLIGEKAGAALAANLKVIACVGEQLEDREAGNTSSVVIDQLSAFKANISDWSRVVVAYEPVWAIGTGKTASAEQAQEVHAVIRKWVADEVGADAAAALRIIYGGSVKPANAAELGAQPDVDGFLVGGASLKAADFAAIINARQ